VNVQGEVLRLPSQGQCASGTESAFFNEGYVRWSI
jgi:hypothetical protein